MSLLCLVHHVVLLWRSPRRWSRGATNPVQIRWKSHVSFPLSWGRWPSLIRRIRLGHHCTHTASLTGSLLPACAIKSPVRLHASEPSWLPGSRHRSIASMIRSSRPEKGANFDLKLPLNWQGLDLKYCPQTPPPVPGGTQGTSGEAVTARRGRVEILKWQKGHAYRNLNHVEDASPPTLRTVLPTCRGLAESALRLNEVGSGPPVFGS